MPPSYDGRVYGRPCMRLVLNILWFVLCGLWMAIGYVLAALLCFITIIGIPFGIAPLRIARFALWPFGRPLVKRPGARVASGLRNVIWLVPCGWGVAAGPATTGVSLSAALPRLP